MAGISDLRFGILSLAAVWVCVNADPRSWLAAARASDPNPTVESSHAVVSRMKSRSEQVFSGKLVFRFRVLGTDREYNSDIIFSGPSWRSSAVNGALLNHGDKYIKYVGIKQQDGKLRHTAHIGLPQRMMGEIRDRLVSGSWWGENTLKFLGEKSRDGKRKGDTEVQGLPCEIWDWAIGKEAVWAFDGVTDLTENGGVLRLYCSPARGYVVPRIEKLAPNGQLAARFECEKYREDAPGIFLPRRLSYQCFNSRGKLSEFEYVVDEVQMINAPIPDDEFKVNMVYGTEVMDSRPGRQNWYVLTEDLPLSTTGFQDVAIAEPPPSFLRRNRTVGLILGFFGGLAAVGIVWWLGRRRSNHQGR